MDFPSLIKSLTFTLILPFLSLSSLQAQIESGSFDKSLLPVGFEMVHAMNDGVFLCLPKEQGLWSLSKKDYQNKTIWEKELNLKEDELISHSLFLGDKFYVLKTHVDESSETSEIRLSGFSSKDGQEIPEKSLWKKNISGIVSNSEKAKIIATPEMEMAAIKGSKNEVPLLYRFRLDISPSKNYIMLSFFDYSQEKMVHDYRIYNANLELKFQSEIALDHHTFLYDICINDEAEIYHSNLNEQGDIQVVEFKPGSEEFNLLTITAGNSERHDLQLHILDNHRVLVASKTEADGTFYGALYGVLDFEKSDLERVHFEPMPESFNDIADSLQRIGELMAKNWTNFELSTIRTYNDEELLLIYESMDFRRSGYVYREMQFTDRLSFSKHKVKITMGPAMIFSFDKNNALRWVRFINRKLEYGESYSQSSSIFPGDVENEEISFFIADNNSNRELKMDYIYNSWEKVKPLKNGLLLGICTTPGMGDRAIIYSEENRKITIE